MPATKRAALLVYDGDCRFCRYCVDYARARTGSRVDYRAYQTLAPGFGGLTAQDYAAAIQLFDNGERRAQGANAAFVVMQLAGAGGWLWCYRRLPGFATNAERLYHWVARHRPLCLWLARLLIGERWQPLQHRRVSALFLRALALVYATAFISFAVQAPGLIGSEGILPAADFFAAASAQFGSERYWFVPSLLWLASGDTAIAALCCAGVALSVLLWLGYWPRLCVVLLYLLYLSLVHAGQVFMRYQWDMLLLECGFLALVLLQWPRLGLWLYRWLLFRFLLMSGAVKLLSGDSHWRQLTALEFHFETQPLPTALAWYAHQLPDLLLRAMTAATFFIELVLPFFIFAPRQLRALAAMGIVLLQLVIAATGNYGFFNLLAVALCLWLLDDAMLPSRLRRGEALTAPHAPLAASMPIKALHRCSAALLAAFVLSLSSAQMWLQFERSRPPQPLATLLGTAQPMHLVNSYGLFAVMTTQRNEIIIEGSHDGENWRVYPLRYKPGDPGRRPVWAAPHQPRLDWQLWFAALSDFEREYWLQQLLIQLALGSEAVAGLFAANPFADAPPGYLRARIYHYRFSSRDDRTSSGHWWQRRLLGNYSPVMKVRIEEALELPP